MSTTTPEKAAETVLTREAGKFNPKADYQSMDPRLFFGFTEALTNALNAGKEAYWRQIQDPEDNSKLINVLYHLPEIATHPTYPNPRQRRDVELVQDIALADRIRDAIEFIVTDNDEIVPLNGLTRLTAVIARWVLDPESTTFLTVPGARFHGTPKEARAEMARLNLGDLVSRPLNEVELAFVVKNMKADGSDDHEIVHLLGLPAGRKGVQLIHRWEEVLGASKAVINAFSDGKIELTDAYQLARLPNKQEQNTRLHAIIAARASGTPSHKARQQAGVGRTNVRLVGWQDLIEQLSDVTYPTVKDAVMSGRNKITLDSIVAMTDTAAREQALDQWQLDNKAIILFNQACWLLKIDGPDYATKFQTIESYMTDNQKQGLPKGFPPAETKPAANSKPETPKGENTTTTTTGKNGSTTTTTTVSGKGKGKDKSK